VTSGWRIHAVSKGGRVHATVGRCNRRRGSTSSADTVRGTAIGTPAPSAAKEKPTPPSWDSEDPTMKRSPVAYASAARVLAAIQPMES
jgi:hypothetical protein